MYKNFIFDMGNVLMDFSPDYILSRYTQNPEEIEILKYAIFGNEIWKSLDNGDVSFETASIDVMDSLPDSLHEVAKDIMSTWQTHKVERMDMLEIVKKLKERGYGIYLCSNAASLFHTYKDKYEVFQYFDDLTISADIGISKPDLGIYRYVLEKNKLDPSSCLFIDDLNENIKAAKQCGISGYQYNGNCGLFNEFLVALEII